MSRLGTTLRRAAAVLAMMMLGIAWPVLAHADSDGTGTHGRIDHVEPGSPDHDVQVLFSIPGLGKDVTLDKGSVQVNVNGIAATAHATTVTGSKVRRTSVLLLDISGSMKGERIAAASQAALTYIDKAPSDVYIGVITFAGKATVVQAPTLDRSALKAAVTDLSLEPGGTKLYPAVEKGLEVAGTKGARSILLLTDGEDNSHVELSKVVADAHQSGVRIDAVGLYTKDGENPSLEQIVDATKGSFMPTDQAADLGTLFDREATDLAKQLLVTFPVPKGLVGTDGSLSVSAMAGGTRYEDHGYVVIGTAAAEQPVAAPDYQAAPVPPPLISVSQPVMWGGIAAIVLGAGALLAYGLTRMAPAKQAPWQRQMAFYTSQGAPAAVATPPPAAGVNVKKSAINLANRLMASRDLEGLLTRKLQAGAVRFTASEWMLLHVGIVIAAGIIGLLVGGPIGMIVLIVLGVLLPWLYLVFKESHRKKAFQGQLADTLQVMASGLQAGQSLPQAVDTAAKEGADPVASEFRKAIIEQRLGVDITDSLDDIAERMGSQDFRWVVMAIRIQREVGGNLAELLTTVSATLREREYLRRQVRTLSAEGRLSAWIIGGLPPVFVIYLILVRGQYLAPMLHSMLGWVMIGYGIVSMIAGTFWLSKVVKVDA